MSSIPASIVSGSYQSASNVADAFEAYRRTQSQYSDFVSGSLSSSSQCEPDPEVASCKDDQLDFDPDFQSGLLDVPDVRERPRNISIDGRPSHVEWDNNSTPRPTVANRRFSFDIPTPRPSTLEQDEGVSTPRPHLGERAPLLIHPSPSRTPLPHTPSGLVDQRITQYASIQRPVSVASVRSTVKPEYRQDGRSTFSQTLINAVAVLFGIGMLSQPLAFAYAGWVGGTLLIIACGFISCYTAKILARIVLQDPTIRSYADIGRKAFGPRSSPIISVMFGLELFTVSVALVTLYADSLYAVVPEYSSNTYKVIGLVVLIPGVLMPLSVLSYTSIVGIFALLAIIAIILFDGFTKLDSPGSLWSPADTSLGIDNYRQLGIAFGLFMAGFAGHTAIPTLARDMVDPTQFDRMIDWAFLIATGTYGLLGVVGYIMFGNSVSDEFSQDLIQYNTHPALNTIALWGLVVTPLTKYALTARPLNVTIEILLGLESTTASSSDHGASPPSHVQASTSQVPVRAKLHTLLIAIERIALAVLSVAVSILVPEFASIMAVLGSTFAFLLCIIGPVSAKIALAGGIRKCGMWDGLVLLVSVGMALWGTFCAMESAAPIP